MNARALDRVRYQCPIVAYWDSEYTYQQETKMSKYLPTSSELQKIESAFTYHAPFGSQSERYVAIRDAARSLALLMAENCPYSRELSLAITNLEQSVMWANASIARNETLGAGSSG